MSETTADTSAEPNTTLSHLLDGRWFADARTVDRRFWYGLALALALHSLLLISINAAKPRTIGDPSGAEDAFSVDLVTEADLNSRSAVADSAGTAPGQPAPPPQAPSAAQPQSQPQPETPPEAAPEPEPAPTPKTEAKPEPSEAIKPTIAEDVPDAVTIPEPGVASEKKPEPVKPEELQLDKLPETLAEKPIEKPIEKTQAKPAQKPAEKRTAKLDLSPPSPAIAAPPTTGGGAAGVERPPGITRSGANDDFARGVIRALQRTMPQLSDTLGRVTVRIVLNDTGNLADVKVVRASDVAGLDQSVMFATRQSSYPLPPPNSKDVDRIFVVTYIYR